MAEVWTWSGATSQSRWWGRSRSWLPIAVSARGRRALATASFGRGRARGFAVRKIQRRYQGGAHGQKEEMSTKIWRCTYLESPESLKLGGDRGGLRRANTPARWHLGWGKKRGIGEDGEGFK
jgi:hypothetical protein